MLRDLHRCRPRLRGPHCPRLRGCETRSGPARLPVEGRVRHRTPRLLLEMSPAMSTEVKTPPPAPPERRPSLWQRIVADHTRRSDIAYADSTLPRPVIDPRQRSTY